MNTSKVVKVMKLSAVMENLALRINADMLFDAIEKSKEDTIKIDFKGIKTMSRSFAQQYLTRKNSCKKKVIEINVSEDVSRMFDLVKKKKDHAVKFKAEEFERFEVPAIA